MAKLCPLFSGSKANCTYISGSGEAVLVDAGASLKATLSAVDEIKADGFNSLEDLIRSEKDMNLQSFKEYKRKYL